MIHMTKADIRKKMGLLRDSYLRQLPEKMCEVDSYYEMLLKDPGDGETVRELHRLAHSIKGSSASFGFKEVSLAAQSLQKFLQPFVEGEAKLDGGRLSDAHAIIELLMERIGFFYTKQAEAARKSSLTAPQDSTVDEENKNKLVCVVEDDPSLSERICGAIRQFGYEVACFSGCDGLEKAIDANRPLVVILDFSRPGKDPAETERIIRIRKKLGSGIPAIFLSDQDSVDARLQAVRAGSDAYFVKPVNIADLVDGLESLTTGAASEPYRILVVDDEPELARYHSLILQDSGMATDIVNIPMEVFDHLSRFNPDLILMDMYMPGFSGMELAKTIRQMKAYFGIPIVFLSGETNIDKQLSAMTMGGDEFLTKPIRPWHLISSVTVRAERMRIIRSFMERDSLTGLLNHTRIKLQLDIALARSLRTNRPAAFAMIDIDKFKLVNDTYGHPVGDRVIVSLSRLLEQRLRKTDVIGRYGGEEFAVVFGDTGVKDARDVLDRIRASFSQIKFNHEGQEFSVTFSAGIAGFPEFRGEDLCNAADKALYEAKRNGRNRIAIA